MDKESIFRLKELTIDNFRCFKSYSISRFGEHNTVFIGRNGVGKTTVLTAIVNALSFVFSKSDVLKRRNLSSGNPDLTVRNISPLEIYTLYHREGDGVVQYGFVRRTRLCHYRHCRAGAWPGKERIFYLCIRKTAHHQPDAGRLSACHLHCV